MAGLSPGLRRWSSTIAIVVAWQVSSSSGIVETSVLPGPLALLGTAWDMITDGSLPQALAVSLGRVLVGSAIGISAGVLLGVVAGLWRLGDDLVDRPVQMLRTLPFTALTPLLVLWLGFGEAPTIALVVIATVVPMYLNTVGGVRGVDPGLLEVAAAYRLGARHRALRILLPGAVGPILVGLRYALGLAWIAVIVAETAHASSGIGHLLTTARTYVRTDIMLVCVVVYALLGLLTDAVVRAAEHRLLRWSAPVSSRTRERF